MVPSPQPSPRISRGRIMPARSAILARKYSVPSHHVDDGDGDDDYESDGRDDA